MKILYDHQIFSWQKYGGISRYFCELFSHFPKETEIINSTVFTDNVYLKNYSHKYISLLSSNSFKGKIRTQTAINKYNSNMLLGKNDYDVFHPTYYNPYFLDKVKSKPIVLTVHDMTHELYTDLIAQDNTTNEKLSAINRANKIIAVSQQTKNDIINVFKIEPEKIDVIYHGINFDKLKNCEANIINKPYILYVGERLVYKNFNLLLDAFKVIKDYFPDLLLVCTGKIFTKEEQKTIADKKLSGYIRHISANELQLAQLYSNAELFVYPSLSEGFGFPILEAMLYNCPVVLSDIMCFNEVAGEAGHFFDPYKIDSLIYSLREVLTNDSVKQDLANKGLKRVKQFSWTETAQKTFDVYKSLI